LIALKDLSTLRVKNNREVEMYRKRWKEVCDAVMGFNDLRSSKKN